MNGNNLIWLHSLTAWIKKIKHSLNFWMEMNWLIFDQSHLKLFIRILTGLRVPTSYKVFVHFPKAVVKKWLSQTRHYSCKGPFRIWNTVVHMCATGHLGNIQLMPIQVWIDANGWMSNIRWKPMQCKLWFWLKTCLLCYCSQYPSVTFDLFLNNIPSDFHKSVLWLYPRILTHWL